MALQSFRAGLPAGAARFEKLLAAIDERLSRGENVVLAIEGSSASGKTTLAALLAGVYDCNVFHMDDFFLQPHQRTPERFAEPGGNVDYERFQREVLLPLSAGKPFSYRPFSCAAMALAAPIAVSPKRLNVVEGAYSMHPTLRSFYDLSVFLRIDKQTQAERILLRNGAEKQQRFLSEWIPMEKRYFEFFGIENLCSLHFDAI